MNKSLDRRSLVKRGLSLTAAALWAPTVLSQTPSGKPIRLIVPYPPGGFTDTTARLIGQKLQERLGQTVVVDNRSGANGILGADAVAKAAPDGTTFGVVIAAHAANTTLYPKLPYNPRKDLAAVSLIGLSPLLAAVNNSSPIKNAADLIAYARANPGAISYGSSGNGSAAHLTGELLQSVTKTQMTHVPYRGAAAALTDLMGGQIQLFFDAASGLINAGSSGKVRLIGVAGTQRLPVLPELPTFAEQGIANFTGSTWAGVIAPAKVPREIIQRVADEIARIVRTDDVKARLEAMGTIPVGNKPEEFEAFLAAETTKWGNVIRTANVKAD
jgi:tripartite-type tricarboxylate transporter receptor subunit TctC